MAKPKTKTVIVADLPDCDICLVDFPNAKRPCRALFEGPCGGPWANACESHADNLTYKAVRYVLAADERSPLIPPILWGTGG